MHKGYAIQMKGCDKVAKGKIMLLNLSSIKEMFIADSKNRKANKSANQVVLNAIALVEEFNPTLKIECDLSRGGNIPSRGITVENLIKVWYKHSTQKTTRYASKGYDFKCNGINYEVKCSTSKGYAHYNPKQDLSNLIFVDSNGIYLTSGANIVLDKCGKHIQTIKINKNVKTLVEW